MVADGHWLPCSKPDRDILQESSLASRKITAVQPTEAFSSSALRLGHFAWPKWLRCLQMDLSADLGSAPERHLPDSRDVIAFHSLDMPQNNGVYI
jgi:hypothetical protein